jgi:hypothetical protein
MEEKKPNAVKSSPDGNILYNGNKCLNIFGNNNCIVNHGSGNIHIISRVSYPEKEEELKSNNLKLDEKALTPIETIASDEISWMSNKSVKCGCDDTKSIIYKTDMQATKPDNNFEEI